MLKLAALEIQPPVTKRGASRATPILWFYPLSHAFQQLQYLHFEATHGSGAHAALYTTFHNAALGQFLGLSTAGRQKVASALFGYAAKSESLNGLVDLALTCYVFIAEQEPAKVGTPQQWITYLKTANSDLGNKRALIYNTRRKQFKSVMLSIIQRVIGKDLKISVPLLVDQNPLADPAVESSDEGICRQVVAIGSVIVGAAAAGAAGYGVGRYGGRSGVGDGLLYGVGGALAAGGHQDGILDTLGICGGAAGISDDVDTNSGEYKDGFVAGIKDALSGEISQTDHTLDKSTWQSGYSDGYGGVAASADAGKNTSINEGDYSAGFSAGFANATGTSVETPSGAGFSADYDKGVKDGQQVGNSVKDDGGKDDDNTKKNDGATTDTTQDKSDDNTAKSDQDKSTVAENDAADKGTGNSTPNPDDPDGHGPWSDVGFPDPDGSGGGGPAARQGFIAQAQKAAAGVVVTSRVAGLPAATAVKVAGGAIQVHAAFAQ